MSSQPPGLAIMRPPATPSRAADLAPLAPPGGGELFREAGSRKPPRHPRVLGATTWRASRLVSAARLVALVALAALALLAVSCAPRTPRFDRARLTAELREPLADWTTYWRRYDPAFALDSLRWSVIDSIHVAGTEPLSDSVRTRAALRWYAWSPDRTRAVDPDTYREWEPETGTFGYEPDARAVLYDFAQYHAQVLESCGTPCRYDDARWLDRDRFVLMGWIEELDPVSAAGVERFSPRVTVYDLERRTVAYGIGRAVPMRASPAPPGTTH